MPLKIEGHTIPHFKAHNSRKLEPRRLSSGSIFSWCYVLLNLSHLLHKLGLSRFVSLNTIYITISTFMSVCTSIGVVGVVVGVPTLKFFRVLTN